MRFYQRHPQRQSSREFVDDEQDLTIGFNNIIFLINDILGLNPSAMDRGNLHPSDSFCRSAVDFPEVYRLGYRTHLHY